MGLFIFDCCFGGSFLINAPKRRKTRGGWIDKLAQEKSRIVITSGLSQEKVDDDNGLGHSPFTAILISLLYTLSSTNNHGSVLELFIQLRKKCIESSTMHTIPKMGRFDGDEGGDCFLCG